MPDYSDVFDEDRASDAQANLHGAHGVSPAAGASAFNDAPLSNVPPTVGMHVPDEGAQLAAQRREAGLLASSPPLQAFAAKSSAHVAATRDDWGNLHSIGDFVNAWTDRWTGTREAAGAVTQEFNLDASRDLFAAPKLAGKLFDLAAAAGGDIVPPLRFLQRGLTEGSHFGAGVLADIAGPGYLRQSREARITDIQNKFGMALWGLMGEGVAGVVEGKLAEAAKFHRAGVGPKIGPEGPTFTDTGFVADTEGNPASFPDRSTAASFLRTYSAVRGGPLNVGEYTTFFNSEDGVYHVVKSTPTAEAGVAAEDTPIYQARAEADAQFVKSLQDAMKESASFKRTPQLMQEFLDNTDLKGHFAYVDPKAIADLWAQDLPAFRGISNDISDALASGRDVEVPMSLYMVETAGTPYEEWMNARTRFSPEGVSVEGAKELPKVGAAAPVQAPPIDVNAPLTLPETRGQGVQYHGAREEIAALQDEGYYNPDNIYGGETSFYTTDAMDIAKGYGRRNPNAVIYEAVEKTPVHMFDMEEPHDTAFWDDLFGITETSSGPEGEAIEEATVGGKLANLREVMDEIRAISRSYDYSKDDVQDVFTGVQDKLVSQGFGGMRHIGGLKTKNPPHEVKIYFRPATQLELEKVQPSIWTLEKEAVPPTLAARASAAVDAVFKEYLLSKIIVPRPFGMTKPQFERYNLAVEDARADAAAKIKKEAEALAKKGELTEEMFISMARAALVGEPIENLLIEQLRVVAETQGLPIDKEALQLGAQQSLGRLPVKTATNIREAERAFKKTSRDVEDALLKGKVVKAFVEKQRQVLSWFQLEDAHFLAKQYAATVKKFGKLARKKRVKAIAQPFLDHMQAYLGRLGFVTRRNTAELAEALDGVPTEDFVRAIQTVNPAFPSMPPLVLGETLESMPTGKFYEVQRFLKALDRMGREEQTAYTSEGARNLQDLKDEVYATMPPKKGAAPPAVIKVGKPPRKRIIASYDAAHRKVYDLLSYFDNGVVNGPMVRTVEFPLEEAADLEGKLHREVYSPVDDAYWALPEESLKGMHDVILDHGWTVGHNRMPIELTRSNLIRAATFVGHEDGLQKLAAGYNRSPEEIMETLNQHLTKEEWVFVQTVLNQFEPLAGKVSAELRANTGRGLARIEPRGIETAHGKLPGGYMKLKYDRALDKQAARRAEVKSVEIGPDGVNQFFGDVLPGAGFAEERMGYKGPLSLNLSDLSHVFDSHIKYASYARTIASVRRFLNDTDIRGLIESRLGPEYFAQVNPWLNSIVMGPSASEQGQEFLDGVAHLSRVNISKAVLGFSWSTGIAQAAGLANAIAVVGDNPADGAVRIAAGIAKFLRSVGEGRLSDDIFNKSEFMLQRFGAYEPNIVAVFDAMEGHTFHTYEDFRKHLDGVLRGLDKFNEAGLQFIGWMEFLTVTGPTWLAAESKALAAGMTEKQAVLLADKAVRESQGTGRRTSLAAIQRGNPWKLLFYMFQTPFNAQYQRMIEGGRAFNRGDYGKGLNMYFMIGAAVPIIGAILSKNGPKDWSPAGLAEWMGIQVAMGGFRPMFGFGAFTGTIGRNTEINKGVVKLKAHTARDLDFSDNGITKMLAAVGGGAFLAYQLAAHQNVKRPIQAGIQALEPLGISGTAQAAKSLEYLNELWFTDEQRLRGNWWTETGQFLTGVTGGPQADQAVAKSGRSSRRNTRRSGR